MALFEKDTTYILGWAYLYDEYQHSPLSTDIIILMKRDIDRDAIYLKGGDTILSAALDVPGTSSVENLDFTDGASSRVTHIVFYYAKRPDHFRGEGADDLAATGNPSVTSLYSEENITTVAPSYNFDACDKVYGSTIDPYDPMIDWQLLSTRRVADTVKSIFALPSKNDQVGKRFYNNAGFSHTLNRVSCNYKRATYGRGRLFVAQTDFDFGETDKGVVFMSAPGQPDVFNWPYDYVILDQEINRLMFRDPYIYAFTKGDCYILGIEPFVTREKIPGLGTEGAWSASSNDSWIVTAQNGRILAFDGRNISYIDDDVFSFVDGLVNENTSVSYSASERKFYIGFDSGSGHTLTFDPETRQWSMLNPIGSAASFVGRRIFWERVTGSITSFTAVSDSNTQRHYRGSSSNACLWQSGALDPTDVGSDWKPYKIMVVGDFSVEANVTIEIWCTKFDGAIVYESQVLSSGYSIEDSISSKDSLGKVYIRDLPVSFKSWMRNYSVKITMRTGDIVRRASLLIRPRRDRE